jgi:hypothetical protein
MTPPNADAIDYARPGPLTDLSHLADQVEALPRSLARLVEAVQGWIVHPFHAHRYGLTVPPRAQAELQTRDAAEALACIRELDPAPLTAARPVERRMFGNCRHFAIMLTALLRERGIPARARCGFGAYFEPGRYADHWVCEVRDRETERWHLVDAQIDDVQRREMEIHLDATDVPRDEFWVAGQAWLACRRGKVDPLVFGILDMWGLWFVRGNLVRDLAALNKRELLPWDNWGLMEQDDDALGEEELALLDRVAELTTEDEIDAAAVQDVYQRESELRVPATVLSWIDGKPRPETIPQLAWRRGWDSNPRNGKPFT